MTARRFNKHRGAGLLVAATTAALLGCSTVGRAQVATDSPQAGAAPAAPAESPAPEGAAVPGGLSDLDSMTFSCTKAGLNAAAREAKAVPSQGTYQFSYFRLVSDSHHSIYEVHFKSNYEGEKELKYCVALYCQEGWDPKNTQAVVTLIQNAPRPARNAASRAPEPADCSHHRHSPAKRISEGAGEKPASDK